MKNCYYLNIKFSFGSFKFTQIVFTKNYFFFYVHNDKTYSPSIRQAPHPLSFEPFLYNPFNDPVHGNSKGFAVSPPIMREFILDFLELFFIFELFANILNFKSKKLYSFELHSNLKLYLI